MSTFLYSTHFDASLALILGQPWLPWVGTNYAQLPSTQRCLIVGESHYTNEKDPTKVESVKQRLLGSPTYTREEVTTYCGQGVEKNSTIANLHRLLFLTTHLNRPLAWADLSCYNFI